MYTHIYKYVWVYIYMGIYIYIHPYIFSLCSTRIYVHTYMYMYTCIHTYAYTQTHIDADLMPWFLKGYRVCAPTSGEPTLPGCLILRLRFVEPMPVQMARKQSCVTRRVSWHKGRRGTSTANVTTIDVDSAMLLVHNCCNGQTTPCK